VLPTAAHYARSSTFFVVIVQYHPARAVGFDDAAVVQRPHCGLDAYALPPSEKCASRHPAVFENNIRRVQASKSHSLVMRRNGDPARFALDEKRR
jgi:hypothetical protein